MVASRGLATFFKDHVSLWDFLSHQNWNPSQVGKDGTPEVGALPMIVGSFSVTVLSAILATPFAVSMALFMTEIAPKRGQKVLQPVIELLVGIPSVVYGFVGLTIVVPVVRAWAEELDLEFYLGHSFCLSWCYLQSPPCTSTVYDRCPVFIVKQPWH